MAAVCEGRRVRSCREGFRESAVLLSHPDLQPSPSVYQSCASARLITAEEVLQSTTSEPTTIKYTDVFLFTRLLKRKYFLKNMTTQYHSSEKLEEGRKGYKGGLKQNF